MRMDWTGALTCLKAGLIVAREGWNGKGMWLAYVSDWNGQFPERTVMPPAFRMAPFVAMKTADDKIVPWVCSQTDMLAEDWGIVDMAELHRRYEANRDIPTAGAPAMGVGFVEEYKRELANLAGAGGLNPPVRSNAQ